LPVIGSALPARFAMYAALFAALLVARALAVRPSRWRWALATVGIVATLPNLQLQSWSSDVPRPRFFERGDADVLRPGSTVLVLPYGPAGWSMLWQAETGFRFRMIGGHFGLRVTPAERDWRDVYERLGTGTLSAQRLRSFLAAHDVDVVLVASTTRTRARQVVERAVGTPGDRVHDVVVYRVTRGDRGPDGLEATLGTWRR
jgi:hypothetical protein